MNDNIPKTKDTIEALRSYLNPKLEADDIIVIDMIIEEIKKQQCLQFEKFLLKTDIAYESVYTSFLEHLNKEK